MRTIKKVTAFIGSPRENGNTMLIINNIIESIKTLGISSEKVFLANYNIAACNGCLLCMKTGKCIISDDMKSLYSKIEQSDGFILASPTYNYNITSTMKAFIDRLFCYYQFTGNGEWRSRLDNSKKAIVVGVCAGPDKENMGYTIQAMKKPLKDLKIKVIKEICYYNSMKVPIKDNIDFQRELGDIGIKFGTVILNDEK